MEGRWVFSPVIASSSPSKRNLRNSRGRVSVSELPSWEYRLARYPIRYRWTKVHQSILLKVEHLPSCKFCELETGVYRFISSLRLETIAKVENNEETAHLDRFYSLDRFSTFENFQNFGHSSSSQTSLCRQSFRPDTYTASLVMSIDDMRDTREGRTYQDCLHLWYNLKPTSLQNPSHQYCTKDRMIQ